MSESHRKFTPMIVSEETRASDAEVAAQWAAEALRDGRYELGAALANIARNANRAEQANRAHDERTRDHEAIAAAERARMVPMLGQTREETPRTPVWDSAAAQMPDPAPAPSALAEEAATAIFGPPVSPAHGGPAARKCGGEVIHDRGSERFREACPSPIYWTETPGAPGHTGEWHHIDPAYDNDHVPVLG